jgi:hypothetical protein
MTLSIRLSAEDKALLEQAASVLHLSKSERIRRSIGAYAARIIPSGQSAAAIDALFIGKGGDLRQPETVTDPRKRAIVERLREKQGYAG